MASVTLWRGAVYRHREPTLVGPLAGPVCGPPPGAPRPSRIRTVEHPDANQPPSLVVRVGQYPCSQAACPPPDFTPPLVAAAPYAPRPAAPSSSSSGWAPGPRRRWRAHGR